MHTPDRRDAATGSVLMIPAVILTILSSLPVDMLFHPGIVAGSIIGLIFTSDPLWLGYGFIYLLYYMGLGAVVIHLVSRVIDWYNTTV
ncbi:hypothetical protein ACFQJ7_00170 [Halovenus rubra]|uniref:Uncharacterized protein n=2 Tax=Halovenus rubra TaxID=869890 RepID=A0ACC7E0X5_9EURY|nr:hypothetical protein [Halovenus rubra]